ncbi:MAG: glycosyltransferase family 4 protein [Pirellulales bacterium]|nr:glycosyltransferase family 4 protein [Pirellulales bacterium]
MVFRRRIRGGPNGSPGERWVILTQYYPPEPGAPQIRLHTLARHLQRAGIDVRVLTGMPNYPQGVVHEGYRRKLQATETIDGIPVSRVWLYPATGRSIFRRLANYLSFTFTATAYLLFMPKIDMLFVESQPISLGIAGVMLKWLRGIPYVYNIPDLQADSAKQLGFVGARVLLRIAVGMEQFFMRQSWTVSTVTNRFIEYYVDRGIPRAKLTFLPNGADIEVLRPLPYDEQYARRLGVFGKKVFTYAGTHAYYHGLEALIEAARLLQDRPDIVILLVGQGPVRENLRRMARVYGLENVVFGDSPFAEMPQLMSITYASVVVMKDIETAEKMRLSKTFPPLACGVPVIHSGRGEAADLIVERECGLCAPPDSPQDLQQVIRSLADDQALRDKLGANGRRFITEELSWEQIITRWLEQLRALRARDDAPPVPQAVGATSASTGAHAAPAVGVNAAIDRPAGVSEP